MPTSEQVIRDRIVKLADAYRAAGVQPREWRDGPHAVPFWDFERGPIGREGRLIAKAIVALNPNMLSVEAVQSEIQFPLLTNLIDNRSRYDYASGSSKELTPIESVERTISRLEAFNKMTKVGVPLLHLPVARDVPFEWGGVTFEDRRPWGELDAMGGEMKHLVAYFNGRLNGWASLECPGDGMRVWNFLNETIERSLREIVGAAWLRHGGGGHTPPSLPGRGTDTSFTPSYHDDNLDMPMSTKVALGHARYQAPNDLAEDWGSAWEPLHGIARSPERTHIEQTILDALGWLGAAAEPDLPAMKIVKIATALETLIDEPDPNASSRGITAMLEERTAHLIGGSIDDKIATAGRVRKIYERRSGALHRRASIDIDEIEDSGTVVWQACRALVSVLPDVEATKGLREWATQQRYK